MMCDFLLTNPDKDITGWDEKDDHGVSSTFGRDVVSRFLRKHDMDLICRSGQVVEKGFQFFADKQLVTISCAVNFCEAGNAGVIMAVDESLMCTFQKVMIRR